MSEPSRTTIQACIAGDEAGWAELVRRHRPDVARQMWRFSRDRGVWEELIQDVFVELYYSLPRYTPGATPFEHWVRRIATRVGYRFWKRQARQRNRELADVTAARDAGPAESLEAADAARFLHAMLAELPPPDRLVLTLTYFEECDTRQIADRTGWNIAMVKMRLMRARRRLRAIFRASEAAEPERSVARGE